MAFIVKYQDAGHAYAFSIPDDLALPLTTEPKKFRPALIDSFFTPQLLQILIIQLKENFLLRSEFKEKKQHKFAIKEIEERIDRSGRAIYIIHLKGLANPFVIPVTPPPVFLYAEPQSINSPSLYISDSENCLDAIKKPLLLFCKDVAYALEKEKGVWGKYHKVKSNKPYLISDLEKQKDTKNRKDFISKKSPGNFDQFFDKLKKLLLKLTPEDISSLSEKKKTENAREFIACFATLHHSGFYNVDNKPINFWSGAEAKVIADTTLTSLSDSNVPAVAIMIHLGALLEGTQPELAKMLSGGSSAVFASQAQGVVTVYNSASKNAREGLVLTVGNFHWNNELPILIALINNKIIICLMYSFYDRTCNKWLPPLTIKSEDLDKNVFLTRRSSYPGPEASEEKSSDDYSFRVKKILHDRHPSVFDGTHQIDPLTQEELARPQLRLDKGKQVVEKWKNYKSKEAKTKMSFTQFTALFVSLPKVAADVEIDLESAKLLSPGSQAKLLPAEDEGEGPQENKGFGNRK